MALSATQQFEKLLQQIQYQDPALTNGAVEQVVVHQQSRVWEITLTFPQVLPFAVYQGLLQAMAMSFQQLAKQG